MIPIYSRRKLWVIVAVFALICGFNGVKEKTLHIVFIGDSITYGAAVQDRDHFAPPAAASSALQSMALIKNIAFYNAGKSGATTFDFLPGTPYFENVITAADKFYQYKEQLISSEQITNELIFSIMLGTNDSAIEGPNGAPVSPAKYRQNLDILIDTLLVRYPGAKIVLQQAPWYSDNTYNGARYLKEGRARLLSYRPVLSSIVTHYKATAPNQVYLGDQTAFAYFKKNYKKAMAPQKGHQGIFYLHPNKSGSAILGKKWAKAIYKAAFKDAL